jgi:hypothetical protein
MHPPAIECFEGRELGALRAHRQQSVSEGENWGRCAHIDNRVFRREKTGGIARTPTVECFGGRELGALRAHRQQNISEGKSYGRSLAHQ